MCSDDCATEGQRPAHHAAAMPTFVRSRSSRTPSRGQGASVCSPRHGSLAWGERRSCFRRDVQQGPVCSPPGYAGANRRRPRSTRKATVLSTSAPTVLPAAAPSQLARSFTQPCLHGTALGPDTFNVDGAPAPAKRALRGSVIERPGPELLAASRLPALAQSLRGCCAGPAAVRTALPRPVASNCAPIGVLPGSSATLTRS